MTDLVTTHRGYQKPRPGQKLKDDVLRLIAALDAIDVDVEDLLLALADKSDVGHGHGMGAITGLASALGNKIDVGYHDALANLTDVDVAGVANGMALLRQASKWIPVALQINNIAGLETALNGKATPADITAAVNGLIAAAPGALDTLDELAAALGDDPNFAATITAALGGKLVKAQNLSDLPDKVAARASLEVPSSAAFQTLLDGVVRKDQDQNAQSLAAPLKLNILRNTLQAREQIGAPVVVNASVASVSWGSLGDYRELWLHGLFRPTAADAYLIIQSGAGSADTAANYTTQRTASRLATVFANTSTGAGIICAAETGLAFESTFEVTLDDFNKTSVTKGLLHYQSVNTTGEFTLASLASRHSFGSENFVRFIPSAGLIGIGSYFVLEGVRG